MKNLFWAVVLVVATSSCLVEDVEPEDVARAMVEEATETEVDEQAEFYQPGEALACYRNGSPCGTWIDPPRTFPHDCCAGTSCNSHPEAGHPDRTYCCKPTGCVPPH